MHDQGIAWMIAGGARTESLEKRQMRIHRAALAENVPSGRDAWQRFRQRVAAATGGRTIERADRRTLPTDCCAA